MPKDILVTLNLQHNCHDGKCLIKKTKMVQAERQDTEEHRHMNNLIFHQIDSEDFVEAMSEGHLKWKAHCQKTMPRKKKKEMRALWAHPAEAHHIFLSAKIRGARTGDDNQSCKPWSGLARFPSEGMVKGWRTDRPCSPISFTQRWKVLLGERNLIDNVGGKEATHRQSNGPANRAPTEPFSQPGRMVWTTVHKRSYNMAVRPLWSTPSSNQWVVLASGLAFLKILNFMKIFFARTFSRKFLPD
ncbi:hypothetical protein PGT21_024622 [Puccinia graminis f. sp. tritici]|uniref:Uncharacterized protein n=1 Tax=Puccinia graminis f. sp. tritici TaxID=56615 RepID=A0A5B0N9E0_PUCGR|nr:hypothetical protein PGT21_024622 [Puccinia graminis f. sp. tritici]